MFDIHPARDEHTEAVLDLLCRFGGEREKWRRFVRYPWRRPEESYGLVLLEKGEVKGFLATVHSRLPVGGTEKRFCNLGPWIVDTEARLRGGFLLKTAIEDDSVTYTALSPKNDLVEPLKRQGFRTLETHSVQIPFTWARPGRAKVGYAAAERLDPTSRRIYEDHRTYPCRHALIEAPEGSCYVLYNVKRAKLYRYAFVNHVSRGDAFAAHLPQFAGWLLLTQGLLKVHWEKRMAPAAPGGKEVESGARLYRSPDLAPADVTNAYTELAMLSL